MATFYNILILSFMGSLRHMLTNEWHLALLGNTLRQGSQNSLICASLFITNGFLALLTCHSFVVPRKRYISFFCRNSDSYFALSLKSIQRFEITPDVDNSYVRPPLTFPTGGFLISVVEILQDHLSDLVIAIAKR